MLLRLEGYESERSKRKKRERQENSLGTEERKREKTEGGKVGEPCREEYGREGWEEKAQGKCEEDSSTGM